MSVEERRKTVFLCKLSIAEEMTIAEKKSLEMESCMRLKNRGGVDVFEEGHRDIGNGGRVRWMLFHLMSR